MSVSSSTQNANELKDSASEPIRAVDQSVLELLQQYGARRGCAESASPEDATLAKPAESRRRVPSAENCDKAESNATGSNSSGSGPSGLTVHQLTAELGVTQTAVRQRLERLIELGLIERHKHGIGRGRPQFCYYLTKLGSRYAAASYADLATALWHELMDLPNPQQRNRVLRRVAKRMGDSLDVQLPESASVNERMTATVDALSKRKIAAKLIRRGKLPVLEVHSCPYPEITDETDGRHMCEMEQEMLSEAVGQPMQLDCCRLDGHDHCQFRPVEKS